MEGLEQAGYKGAAILEIGSGVGHLQQTLLERGAASAVGVDLSSRMIEEAQHWADDRGLAERTKYVQGDFMEIKESLPDSEVTVLDKVVCCYPDADGLVNSSLSKTRRVYALTYPRDRWYVRALMGLMALVMIIVRSDFRPYVHAPERIESWIVEAGFDKLYQNRNLMWLTQVYVKP